MSENQIDSLKPIEFYRFSDLNGNKWLYTDSYKNEVLNNEVYNKTTITRGITESTNDQQKQGLSIKCPVDLGFVVDFVPRATSSGISVSVFRVSNSQILVFSGKVNGISKDGLEANINCANLMSDLNRKMGRYPVQPSCTNVLYDTKCTVNRELFKVQGTVESATNNTITSSQFGTKPNGWFVGGEIRVNGNYLTCLSHTGNTLTLLSSTNFNPVGQQFTAYAGCNRTITICDSKFSNHLNFNGYIALPNKNPFSGDSFI